MPRANNLVAALCLALLGALVGELVKPQLPEGSDAGRLTLICAVIGLGIGWRVMGPKAGKGRAISNGITGVVALLFSGLLVFGSIEMLNMALRRRYQDPIEAIEHVVTLASEYSLYLAHPTVIVSLVVGALVSGAATESAYKRWR